MSDLNKILVIEDDNFLANAYRVKFSKAGFDMQIASDGEEALKILETYQPDLIILDLVMPVKDGFETLKEVRQIEKFKETPIIISSNLGQREDIDRGMALGATDYIVKSEITLDNLVKKVNSVLGLEI